MQNMIYDNGIANTQKAIDMTNMRTGLPKKHSGGGKWAKWIVKRINTSTIEERNVQLEVWGGKCHA